MELVEVSFEKSLTQYLLDAVIKLAIYDKEFLEKFCDYLLPRLFQFPRREVVECVRRFWLSKRMVLGDFIFQEVSKFVSERRVHLVVEYLSRLKEMEVNKEYVFREFADFVKQQILLDGIQRASKAISERNFKYAEGIVLGVFQDISKLSSDNVKDLISSYELSLVNSEPVLSLRTGIRPYDEVYGGLWEKEFVLVMGDTSVGKTFCMVYLGKVALVQGKKVLHVTLETSKEVVWERYKMSFTAQVSDRLRHIVGDEDISEVEVVVGGDVLKVKILDKESVRKKLEMLKRRGARLWLYQALQFSVRDLYDLFKRIEIKEGVKPDLVIIDSPDQMVGGGSGEELRMRERDIYRRLLDFAKEKNVVLVVTTQVRRGSKRKYLVRAEDVAEAYDKVRIVDTVWVLNQTEEERDAGLIRIYVDKNRTGRAGLLIEGDQCLAIGQFILKARKLNVTEYLQSVRMRGGSSGR